MTALRTLGLLLGLVGLTLGALELIRGCPWAQQARLPPATYSARSRLEPRRTAGRPTRGEPLRLPSISPKTSKALLRDWKRFKWSEPSSACIRLGPGLRDI